MDRTWNALSQVGKIEFEIRYGKWEAMTDEQRYAHLGGYFSYLRQQAEEEKMKKIVEPIVETLKEFASGIITKANRMEHRIEQIEHGLNETREIRGIERVVGQQTPMQEIKMVGTPTGIQPQVNVYTSYPMKMDCRYREKGGPKECIIVESSPEGRYGTCTVGDQVRRMQILPRWATSAFEKAGCPSNRLVKSCEFYLSRRVQIS